MVSTTVVDTEGRLKRRAKWSADLAENTRQRRSMLGHVPLILTLCFVVHSGEKAKVGLSV